MMKLSDIGGGASDPPAGGKDQEGGEGKAKENGGSLLDKYSDYIDVKTGSLMFKGKATLTNRGVEFESGKSFSISLDEVDTLDELGKGNYGTVYKVRHSRPRIRRPGLGLAGNKALPGQQASPTTATFGEKSDATSGMVMAMKEIRLELDDAKFAAIIMELDILHRCVSPFIVDFYGAFFQEGAVYICMEYMDGGSIDKLYGDGIPESVLRKIALATTMGLKSLKEEHNIIHRDVKPTNILVNTHGQVKICDFGVSGNLVASIAKTNIGCQSYMAPERISSGGVAQAGANPGGGTYSVQSDIWSLGLTIIECAMGQYPYPPETYDNIFSQLSVSLPLPSPPPGLASLTHPPGHRRRRAARPSRHRLLRGRARLCPRLPRQDPQPAPLVRHAAAARLVRAATQAADDRGGGRGGRRGGRRDADERRRRRRPRRTGLHRGPRGRGVGRARDRAQAAGAHGQEGAAGAACGPAGCDGQSGGGEVGRVRRGGGWAGSLGRGAGVCREGGAELRPRQCAAGPRVPGGRRVES